MPPLFLRILHYFYILFFRIRYLPIWISIVRDKKEQKKKFHALKNIFLENYNKFKTKNISEFITPGWEYFNKLSEKVFIPEPSFSFLRKQIFLYTMFSVRRGRLLFTKLKFLEDKIPYNELKNILEEDYVGGPVILNGKYRTSYNSIQQLYHLINFEEKTGVKIKSFKSIIEYGGGYGRLALIVKRFHPLITYTIIDLPLFSCIQWLYLSTVMSTEDINLLTSSNDKIMENKINLLPVCFMKEKVDELSAELFIALWSLSESSKYAQEFVDSLRFFNARHFIIGFQEKSSEYFPSAGNIKNIVEKYGAEIIPFPFVSGYCYALK